LSYDWLYVHEFFIGKYDESGEKNIYKVAFIKVKFRFIVKLILELLVFRVIGV
jgi:hypothetical protein